MVFGTVPKLQSPFPPSTILPFFPEYFKKGLPVEYGMLVTCVLQWRHNECDSVWNHRRLECLLSHCSDADQRKHQNSVSLAFVRGIHRWESASKAENVSIWWRHHGMWFSGAISGTWKETSGMGLLIANFHRSVIYLIFQHRQSTC